MSLLTTLVIAVGLSMDAFAVAVAIGAALKTPGIKDALITGLFFGFFQFIMPVIGWTCGSYLSGILAAFDHWAAFLMLAFVGIKMLKESFETENKPVTHPKNFKIMLMLSIATSIDALAVGLSFSFLHTAILAPALLIGAVTFAFSAAGTYAGACCGKLGRNKAEFAGGVILIAIGVKILLEHIFAKG